MESQKLQIELRQSQTTWIKIFFKTVKHTHTLIYQLLKEVILGSCQIIKFSLFLFGIYFVHILIKYVYFESIKKNFKRCSLIKMWAKWNSFLVSICQKSCEILWVEYSFLAIEVTITYTSMLYQSYPFRTFVSYITFSREVLHRYDIFIPDDLLCGVEGHLVHPLLLRLAFLVSGDQ